MYRKYGLAALFIILLFLAGCQSTLVVRNVTTDKIIPLFEDYAGVHGYEITYRNDQTGSYRLSLGNVYVPTVSETVKQTSGPDWPPRRGPDWQPLTNYEETTWKTVSVPGHYVEATAMISITQQASDVMIVVDGNDAAGSSLDDLGGYLKGKGYTVENK